MKPHIYRLRIGRWRLYLSNIRLKKMNPAGQRGAIYGKAMKARKQRHFHENGGVCDVCGKPIAWHDVEMHHILPYSEFPQYGTNPANVEIVCNDCHHALHRNPYTNLLRMEQKARELGFDLKTYYNK